MIEPSVAAAIIPAISRRRTVTPEPTRSHPASIIAIDGPAASGKSAIGLALASRLGYRFFDTGAMYRAITWLAIRRGIDPNDEHALAGLAETTSIKVRDMNGGAAEPTGVLLDGEDATPHLREPTVETNVSLVSRVPRVRAALLRIQRDLASAGRVVMAGRDIGSVVLPDAGLKIYLDASREVRARRRMEQLESEGIKAHFDEILADLTRRDGIDESRATSPLTAAAGAEIIKTDQLTIEEAVARILNLAA